MGVPRCLVALAHDKEECAAQRLPGTCRNHAEILSPAEERCGSRQRQRCTDCRQQNPLDARGSAL